MIKLRKIRYSTELYHYGIKGQNGVFEDIRIQTEL